MALTIPVAHDFICPWCWVGLLQAKKLIAEEGVEIEWLGYELLPIEMEWPEPSSPPLPMPNKPPVLSRFEFLLVADGIKMPKVERPKGMRSNNAHQALEFAKEHGKGFEFCEALYRAYWEEGRAINEIKEIKALAKKHGLNAAKMAEAVETVAYGNKVVGFDAPAYKSGVFNVPTFYIGGERYAEQPYSVLLEAVKHVKKSYAKHPYETFTFPPSTADRPYTIIDMVTTIDGKTISGKRGEPVDDLGSKTDHSVMRHLQDVADGVMIGAGTLRASPKNWNPKTNFRVVVSGSGNVDTTHSFFKGPESFVATPESGTFLPADGVQRLKAGKKKLKVETLMHELRDKGCEKLLVLGGSSLNAELLRADLVDEIFVTVAPKIKLGENVPTLAGGEPLAREAMLGFKLVEHFEVGDEIFLRYRRAKKR